MVIRHQQRAVLHDQHVHRPPDILVVLQEAGHERHPGFHAAVPVELHGDDVAADLLRLVPRAVPRDEDRVAVFLGEHGAGVEAHAKRGRMRPEQRNRLLELVARTAPTHLAVGEIPLMAVREAEVLTDLGDAVELVIGQVFRQPVAAVVGEVELLRRRMPVEADRVAHAARDHLGSTAVEADAADLPVGLRRLADVAGRADIYIELLIRPETHELPAVRLMIEEVAVDDGRLSRIVDLVLDALQLGNARALGDVERALVEGEAVRPIQARGNDLDLALAARLGDRIDLVEQAVADEDGALVAEPQGAGVGDPAGIDLDLEALGQLELPDRQLVLGGRNWWRRDAAQLGVDLGIGNVGTARDRARLRLVNRHRGAGRRRLSGRPRCRLLSCGGRCRQQGAGGGDAKTLDGADMSNHAVLPGGDAQTGKRRSISTIAEKPRARPAPSATTLLLAGHARAAVADAVDRSVPVVGDEQRAVLQHLDVDRPPDIAVVLEEAGEERLDRLHGAVLLESYDGNVAAELLAPIP